MKVNFKIEVGVKYKSRLQNGSYLQKMEGKYQYIIIAQILDGIKINR